MSGRVFFLTNDVGEAVAFRESFDNSKPTPSSPETEWSQLSKGKTLGKRVGIGLASGGGLGSSGMDMFEVRGDDEHSLPLSILLSPPRITAVPPPVTSAPIPNLSGTQYVTDTNFAIADPFARITWGIGGVSNEIDVDIHNGAMLTINASFVRIQGFINDPRATVSDAGYELSAFIGPGQDKGIGGQRTIFTPNDPAVNVASQVREVPKFARRVRTFGAENPPAAGMVVSIVFYRDRAKTLCIAEYLCACNTVESFPVPAGAYFFEFIPRTANYLSMGAIFDLAI